MCMLVMQCQREPCCGVPLVFDQLLACVRAGSRLCSVCSELLWPVHQPVHIGRIMACDERCTDVTLLLHTAAAAAAAAPRHATTCTVLWLVTELAVPATQHASTTGMSFPPPHLPLYSSTFWLN